MDEPNPMILIWEQQRAEAHRTIDRTFDEQRQDASPEERAFVHQTIEAAFAEALEKLIEGAKEIKDKMEDTPHLVPAPNGHEFH